jgi:hypothetical protein
MAITKIQSESLNLADDFAFTGTITGAGGITEADQWRLNADFSVSADVNTVINSNWEKVDTANYGTIGSGMTQSSGIFTFPSTGIYLIHHQSSALRAGQTRYWEIEIWVSTDGGSNFTQATKTTSNIPNLGSTLATGSTQILVDVTSTSLVKVQFRTIGDESYTLRGNTSYTRTGATFIKLGDT